jgi:putative oxidoreductase
VNIGLLVLRLIVGLTLAGHAAQKLFGWFDGSGLQATAETFDQMGAGAAVLALSAAGRWPRPMLISGTAVLALAALAGLLSIGVLLLPAVACAAAAASPSWRSRASGPTA